MQWFIAVLKQYAVFTGRAHRTEYWMFVLFYCIIGFVLGFFAVFVSELSILYIIFALGTIIPSLAVFFRRLHDTGHSGWWWFIGLVPLIGAIVLLVFLVQDSQPGENQYGPNPKGAKALPPNEGLQ